MEAPKRFLNLKTRIMFTTLILVVLSFCLIAAAVFPTLLNSMEKAAEARFLQLSQKYARNFEDKIGNAMNYLSILSSELEVAAESGETDRETLQETTMKVFDEYKLVDGSSVYFEANMYDGRDEEYKGTEYGTAQSGRICWYFYIEDGKTVYLPEGLENDIEFELPHYTNARDSNAPIYTDPVVHEVDGKKIPMFTLTYPIQGSGGEFIGAVTVDLFLDDIYAQLQNEEIYKTGYIIIANDHGRIIYSPDYEDIGKTWEEAGIDYSPASGEEATFFNSISIFSGDSVLTTMETVHNPQLNSDFYISVSAPLEEVNAEGIRLTALLTGFSVLIIAVIALVLFYLIGRISSPLNEITENLNRIAGGDYHTRIKGEYKGELAVVKNSVNTMADRIEEYILESQSTMDSLKTILNGLNAYLYVSDPVTDEILFINNNMRILFDLDDDRVGHKCWAVFQDGFTERCEFCPCFRLDKDPDTPVVWEEHNTVTKQYYRNTDRYIDWVDGRKVHLQHSVDITDIKMAQFALDRRLKQQALMTAITQKFLSEADMDTLIAETLRETGEFLGAAQSLYYKMEDDGATLTCRNEWQSPEFGLASRIGSQLVLEGPMLSVIGSLTKESEFSLNSNDPVLKAVMAPYRKNFQNYIATPVFQKNRVYAILDFSRGEENGDWSDSDINLAVFVSSLLTGFFDRRSMSDQLRRLSSIVESSPQFILYVTADGNVDYVNPAAEVITGYTACELMSGGLDIVFDEGTARDFRERYIPDTLKNGTGNFEIDLIRKDGRRRIMAFSSFTTGQGSENVGCIASDVTEIRELEAELIAAKDLAEQGSRSKSEFLSRMSHEMRTPMNAIIGMTNIAKGSNDPEKKEYCLERINDASTHLLGVINDILDMSKIEANKFDLNYAPFSFDRMMNSVLNVLSFRIKEKNQELSVYVDPGMPSVLVGDEQRLSQVLSNLLTNAAKFTPDRGSIQIGVYVLSQEKGTYTLKIEITDSGIGISKEQQEKLFRSFEQADGSIARKFGGTGLGLAISKRIVELMGGEIWVESELGKGAKFIFTLKVEKGPSADVDMLKKHISVSSLNLMVVDDSPEVCDYFKHVMDDMGVPCVAASGGAEALEIVTNSPKPFDIIFIDWKMPEMDGIELTQRLRASSESYPIIIMISVAEWGDIKNEALEAGVDGFVPKPLFPSLIFDCISKYVGLVSAGGAEEKSAAAQQNFEGKVALLAEDVEINREIILTVLEDTKLKIDCAVNGLQAVEMFAADPDRYDIIFMDIHMPEVDGFEATRRIRALDVPRGAKVPIVAMTANVFREDVEKCMEAGMNDHIGKPIDFDELNILLVKYLK